MSAELEIVLRDVEPYEEPVRAAINEKFAKLERFSGDIMGCRVVVEAPHRHRREGRLFHVRIDLTLPGKVVVVDREPHAHVAHEDIHVAVRDAFRAARRKLEDRVRLLRREVKLHETPPQGFVSKIFPKDGYGFIGTPDGREIYFHKNSVLDDAFARLAAGRKVSFFEEEGEKGPQASTVRLLKRGRSRKVTEQT